MPRNAVLGPKENRTSLSLRQRVPLPGTMSLTAIAEVFNLFNRTNYTLGLQESLIQNYLLPTAGEPARCSSGSGLT